MTITDRRKGDNSGPVGYQAGDSYQSVVGTDLVGPSDWLAGGGAVPNWNWELTW